VDSSWKNCLVVLKGWKSVSCHDGGVSVVCGLLSSSSLLLLLALLLGF